MCYIIFSGLLSVYLQMQIVMRNAIYVSISLSMFLRYLSRLLSLSSISSVPHRTAKKNSSSRGLTLKSNLQCSAMELKSRCAWATHKYVNIRPQTHLIKVTPPSKCVSLSKRLSSELIPFILLILIRQFPIFS